MFRFVLRLITICLAIYSRQSKHHAMGDTLRCRCCFCCHSGDYCNVSNEQEAETWQRL